MRSSRRLESHPDLPLPVLLCAIKSARRMRLRLDERAQVLKVTHPRSVRPAAALEWAACQKRWVAEQLGRIGPPEPLVPGATIPIEGAPVELCWSDGAPRIAVLDSGKLTCGGPRPAFGRRIEQFLRRLALETLSRDTSEIAAAAGLTASSVAIGDARTRWGSCSSSGAIRYSWRLILAPPKARRFVVAHEVAHLMHLNHGAGFRALERELFDGDVREAKALLRRVGPRLRRIGITS
ncbi:MAG TPA: YgjP-like metallopeptidase domain-containing protein [Sphingomicrobium sp.]|nr:YgjP-like metallopeptidase domain-containing protein [Sphingomicrobium sp.]